MRVEILDTTLRDGSQASNISFTLNDKIRIALALDDLGVDYIEGGWPSSNPKDKAFFEEIKKYKLSHSKVAAFGSTKHKSTKAKDDPSLNSIIESGVGTAVLFGKSWQLHVKDVLGITNEANLELIEESISYLRSAGIEVIFDAEHFFKGYADNKEYALEVLQTASKAGARTIVLADTTGSTPPNVIYSITREMVERIKKPIGLHMHNDVGCAVANTLMGVAAGGVHVQGTINGIGERSGNADLITVLPALAFSMGYDTIKQDNMRKLKDVSSMLYSITSQEPNPYQPFVGENAFAHKGGVHVDAMRKNAASYEHIDPKLVGNIRKIVISEVSGSGNLLNFAEALGLTVGKSDSSLKQALVRIKELEKRGYSYDIAEASAMLILLKEMGSYKDYITLDYWKNISEDKLNLAVIKAGSLNEVSEGTGPMHAIDIAIRKAFAKTYPELSRITLTDYKVVLPGQVKNTESTVRVMIEFSDGNEKWRCIGVSKNIINASVEALLDGFNYFLWKNKTEYKKY